MSERIGDILTCPVDRGEFAKMAALLGDLNWRPLSASGTPGWPEHTMPPGPHLSVLRTVFRNRGNEFYSATARLSLLGGLFKRADLFRDFISEVSGFTMVDDALLRAAAVCKITSQDGVTAFDLVDLGARARWFAGQPSKGRITT